MGFMTSLAVGTRIIAARNFGPVIKGQLGIVTGLAKGRRGSWSSTIYACTFLGGARVIASGRHIRKHDHGCSWQVLENPLWFLSTRELPGLIGQYAIELRRSPDWPIG
jgi:hypothetical protein